MFSILVSVFWYNLLVVFMHYIIVFVHMIDNFCYQICAITRLSCFRYCNGLQRMFVWNRLLNWKLSRNIRRVWNKCVLVLFLYTTDKRKYHPRIYTHAIYLRLLAFEDNEKCKECTSIMNKERCVDNVFCIMKV